MASTVTRKIRNGKVKVSGSWYKPSEQFLKYDGRLDGMWYCFGVYSGFMPKKIISLWGSLDYKKGIEKFGKGKEVVDGCLPWLWWEVVA